MPTSNQTKTELSLSIEKENSLKRIVRERILPEPGYRFFNWGRLKKFSKCIGLIGHWGSGKSVSASAIGILDFLVPGYTLVSNLDISWGMRLGPYMVGYASQPLDKMALMNFEIQKKIAIVIDEVNVEFSEARRAMTNRNLIFNKILQQLRKRELNLIYTVPHEMWIDPRLRWHTCIFIKCKDICLQPGGIYLPYDFGEYISWKIYDMIGLMGHGAYEDTQRPLFEDLRFYSKRWWNTYNTSAIQAGEDSGYGKVDYNQMQANQQDSEILAWRWLYEELQRLCSDDSCYLNSNYEIKEIDLYEYLLQRNPEINRRETISYISKSIDKVFSRYSGGSRLFNFGLLVRQYNEAKELLEINKEMVVEL